MFHLKKDPKLSEQYNDVFQVQLSLGIMERVQQSEYKNVRKHIICLINQSLKSTMIPLNVG